MGPLSRYGCVLVPDLLGLGGAPHPDVAYGPHDYDHWLDQEVLGHVRQPVTLVVHDFGGNWAVRLPERVARLVILNTTLHPHGLLARLVRARPFRPLHRWLLGGRGFRWQMRALFGIRDEALIQEYHAVYARPLDLRTVERCIRAWTPQALADIAARLGQCSCPVLLAWGMKDRFIFPWHPHGEAFLRVLPQAQVVHVAEAGHFLQWECPDQLLAHLDPFLERE